MGIRRLAWVFLSLALFCAAPLSAQNTITRSLVLVIDTEELFEQSDLGQQFQAEIDRRVAALNAENAEIATALETEEQALAAQRTTMSAAEFRPLADAFDEKAQRIRAEREDQATEIRRLPEVFRREFLIAANPVFAQIMQERGAAVILDERSVFRFAEVIDVTDEVIAALNAASLEAIPPAD